MVSPQLKRVLQEKKEKRRRLFRRLLNRFDRDRPYENPRCLIAMETGLSYWLVCDVLRGRR